MKYNLGGFSTNDAGVAETVAKVLQEERNSEQAVADLLKDYSPAPLYCA